MYSPWLAVTMDMLLTCKCIFCPLLDSTRHLWIEIKEIIFGSGFNFTELYSSFLINLLLIRTNDCATSMGWKLLTSPAHQGSLLSRTTTRRHATSSRSWRRTRINTSPCRCLVVTAQCFPYNIMGPHPDGMTKWRNKQKSTVTFNFPLQRVYVAFLRVHKQYFSHAEDRTPVGSSGGSHLNSKYLQCLR